MQIPLFSRLIYGPLLGLLLLNVPSVYGQEEAEVAIDKPVSQVDPCLFPKQPRLDWLDRTQYKVSSKICGAALWFDHFFGDARYEEEDLKSRLTVKTALRVAQGNDSNFRAILRAKVRLPQLKNRLQLMISSEEDDKNVEPSNARDGNIREAVGLPSARFRAGGGFIGLRWTPLTGLEDTLQFSAGIRAKLPVRSFVSARYRYSYAYSPRALIRATQSVFWEDDNGGFGESSRLDWEYLFNQRTVLRLNGMGTFSQESEGVDWETGASLLHGLSAKKAISLNLSTKGVTRPSTWLKEKRISILYRQNIYKPWLFVEVEPEVSWIQEFEDSPTERVGAIILRLEAQFGHDLGL